MGKTLNLQVVTPERIVLDQEVESLVVPATEGYLGILPNHAPIITGLTAGPVKYREAGKNSYLAVSGGFMEVSQNNITILADAAERPEEIDRSRAEAARDRALKRLREKEAGTDLIRAELALKRALARLRVAR